MKPHISDRIHVVKAQGEYAVVPTQPAHLLNGVPDQSKRRDARSRAALVEERDKERGVAPKRGQLHDAPVAEAQWHIWQPTIHQADLVTERRLQVGRLRELCATAGECREQADYYDAHRS